MVQNSFADDWNTGTGGNAQRNGISNEAGPLMPNLLWQNSISSVIAQQSIVEGDYVISNRIWDLGNTLEGTSIVAQDLNSGEILWEVILPIEFPTTDWRSRATAINEGVVYASRSGNTNPSYLYALDVEDGSILWQSEDLIDESSTESLVFDEVGDLVIGNFGSISKIDHQTGMTVWTSERQAPSSNGQEVALFEGKIYAWQAASGGPQVSVFNIEDGSFLYGSESLSPGIVQQLGLLVSPDGTIYAPRTQNNVATDFMFALEDTGESLEIKWQFPLRYVPFATFGIDTDGHVLSYSLEGEVVKLDKETGEVLFRSIPILFDLATFPRIAVDRNGNTYVTNGEFAGGAIYAFDESLNVIWSEMVLNNNVGGPALGKDGVLVVCGVGTDVRAYEGSEVSSTSSLNAFIKHKTFPNPSHGDFYLELTMPENMQEGQIQLINIHGAKVFQLKITNDAGIIRERIITKDLPKGNYFLNLESKGGTSNLGVIQIVR